MLGTELFNNSRHHIILAFYRLWIMDFVSWIWWHSTVLEFMKSIKHRALPMLSFCRHHTKKKAKKAGSCCSSWCFSGLIQLTSRHGCYRNDAGLHVLLMFFTKTLDLNCDSCMCTCNQKVSLLRMNYLCIFHDDCCSTLVVKVLCTMLFGVIVSLHVCLDIAVPNALNKLAQLLHFCISSDRSLLAYRHIYLVFVHVYGCISIEGIVSTKSLSPRSTFKVKSHADNGGSLAGSWPSTFRCISVQNIKKIMKLLFWENILSQPSFNNIDFRL